MYIANKTVYQNRIDRKLTQLFKKGVAQYLEFQAKLERIVHIPAAYEQFIHEYGGYNRGLGYVDFNYKNITITLAESTRTLTPIFEIWDGLENYEVDIHDWI